MTAIDSITPSTQVLDDAGRDWAWAFVVFRDIVGFPGYRVGTNQTVYSRWKAGPPYAMCDTWKRMRISNAKSLHKVVVLSRNRAPVTCMVHRLILEAFIRPCPDGMEGCHENGIPFDNRLNNLRWDTRKANVADARRHGTISQGSRNGHAKMTEDQVAEARERYFRGEKQKDLALAFGVSRGQMSMAINAKTWGHVKRSDTVAKASLRGMKKHPEIAKRFAGSRVRIWSGEWNAWWRPEANGYTNSIEEAGLYEFSDAWDRSSHCGDKKKIVYHMLQRKEGAA